MIKRGIFRGDVLSPLLVVVVMMPLYHILRKFTGGYKLSKSQEKINYLMYGRHPSVCKKEKELKTLIQASRVSWGSRIHWLLICWGVRLSQWVSWVWHKIIRWRGSSNFGAFFSGRNYQMKTKSELLKKKKLKNTWDYWKRTQSNKWIWKKYQKEYIRKTRKLLENKIHSRNIMKGINTRVFPLIRCLGPFLTWTKEELQQMDPGTRKLMMKHNTLYPRYEVDRLNVSKRGEWGLASILDCIDSCIQWLKDYKENHGGKLITVTRENTSNTRINRTKITRKLKWE